MKRIARISCVALALILTTQPIHAQKPIEDSKELIETRAKAEKGDASAQFNLGNSYYNGEGVTKDYVEAVKWYRKAAEQNNASAQFNLGNSYYNGEGVPKDYVEGYMWFLLAGAQGGEDAKKNIEIIERKMTREQIAEG